MAVPAVTVAAVLLLLLLAYGLHPFVGAAAETILTYQLLAAKCLREERFLVEKEQKDAVFRAAKEPPERLARNARAVHEARKRLAQNANFRLTMEVMLMEIKEIEPNDRSGRNTL